jgi:hypothetical protein
MLLVKKPAGMEQMWKNVAELVCLSFFLFFIFQKSKYDPDGVGLLRLSFPISFFLFLPLSLFLSLSLSGSFYL